MSGAGGAAGERTLVFVFLRGGLDGLNAVVPTFDADYRRLRPTIALERRQAGERTGAGAIPLDDRFALHPALEPLLPLYREERLAILHAVGSDDATGSHFEAQDQMEHGATAAVPLTGGWLARWLRTGADAGALSALAFGRALPESLRGAPSVAAVTSLDDLRLGTRDPGRSHDFADALERLYARESGLVERAGADALALLRRVEEIRGDAAPPAGYPESDFGRSLAQVARLVRRGVGLRAVAIDQGGYDTHVGQDLLLADELRDLGTGLAAFDADLGDLREQVTVVCLTEFGRRMYENAGLGTDHGRASCAFVTGGGVHGGRVIAEWPGLAEEQAEGPGGLRVTLDYRDVLWEALERRFGATDPGAVFPGLRPRRPGIFT